MHMTQIQRDLESIRWGYAKAWKSDFLLDWLWLVLACIDFKRRVRLLLASGYSSRKQLSLWPSLDNLYSGWWVAVTSTQKKHGSYLSYSSKTICRCNLLLPVSVLITPVYHSLGQSFKAHFVIGSYSSHCFMAHFQAPALWPKSGTKTPEIGKFKVRWTVTVIMASPLIGKVQPESSTGFVIGMDTEADSKTLP